MCLSWIGEMLACGGMADFDKCPFDCGNAGNFGGVEECGVEAGVGDILSAPLAFEFTDVGGGA
jgi:hypothetical protein